VVHTIQALVSQLVPLGLDLAVTAKDRVRETLFLSSGAGLAEARRQVFLAALAVAEARGLLIVVAAAVVILAAAVVVCLRAVAATWLQVVQAVATLLRAMLFQLWPPLATAQC
jgi:hypothetical protein